MKMTVIETNKLTRKNGQAFTLIELLVVISIMSILIAILLPALAKARDRSAAITCASQLKQMGVATAIYANDNKGWLPVAHPSTGAYPLWKANIGFYIKKPDAGSNINTDTSISTGIFLCPKFKLPKPMGVQPYKGGYGWNYFFAGFKENDATRPRKKRMEIEKPSSTILLGDSESADSSTAWNWEWDWAILYPTDVVGNPASRTRGLRHLNAINMSWGDGHVSAMSFAALGRYGVVSEGGSTNHYYFKLKK